MLIVIIADSKKFITKNKQVINFEGFSKLYNCKSYIQVYKIDSIIKFEKIYTLFAKKFYNLGAY